MDFDRYNVEQNSGSLNHSESKKECVKWIYIINLSLFRISITREIERGNAIEVTSKIYRGDEIIEIWRFDSVTRITKSNDRKI